MIRWVVFDIGETLIDETRSWSAWAEWLGVTPLTFLGVLGAVIGQGRPHRDAFEIIRPGIDVAAERAERAAAGVFAGFTPEDLYPDVRPALRVLKDAGYRLGAVGNFSVWIERSLHDMGLPLEFIASSEGWGIEKPARGFFERIVAECDASAQEIVYVGDRLDNDILPALEAGMKGVHIRRGPWGYLHASLPDVERATARIESLGQLENAVRVL